MAQDLDGQSAIGHGDAISVIGDGAISAGMACEALNKRLTVGGTLFKQLEFSYVDQSWP